MSKRFVLSLLAFCLIFTSACALKTATPSPSLSPTATSAPGTLYGFFPTPPRPSAQNIIDHYKTIAQHGNAVLFQQNIPWADFVSGPDAASPVVNDLRNQVNLAKQNGLQVIFVIDPLQGLNRREFAALPSGWTASFADPQIRAAFTNFTLRIQREFTPAYLGLASEINTYADTSPDDFKEYLSLYSTVYGLVKAEAPDTKVFVTFQWEEMQNLIPGISAGKPYETSWEMMEQFEPKLDIWAISSYPYALGIAGKDIPADYYAPLLSRTTKPVAVAEGGYSSEPMNTAPGTPQYQADYLNAIHSQIGGSLMAFWIYLTLADLDMDAYNEAVKQAGQTTDLSGLVFFSRLGLISLDGTPKTALAVWDSFRNSNP